MRHRFTFYLHPSEIDGGRALFGVSESRHISEVLRLQTGAEIEATDGVGNRYRIALMRLEGKRVIGRIIVKEVDEEAPPLPISLALPCLKGERWGWALEGACELGTAIVYPVNYDLARQAWTRNRWERGQRKTVEILKQCGGSRLTHLAEPQSLPEFLSQQSFPEVLLADPDGEELSSVLPESLLVVGPEGGLSETEEDLMCEVGARRFNLGQRRLRSEIAVLAALARMQPLLKLKKRP